MKIIGSIFASFIRLLESYFRVSLCVQRILVATKAHTSKQQTNKQTTYRQPTAKQTNEHTNNKTTRGTSTRQEREAGVTEQTQVKVVRRDTSQHILWKS